MFVNKYQTKPIPINNGKTTFIKLIIFLFKSYFNKLVFSSGNTIAGLKDFASCIDIKA